MKTFSLVDESMNRPIDDEDVARCQRHVDALFSFATSEMTDEELTWGAAEQSVYACDFKRSTRQIHQHFLRTLRQRCVHFTGHEIRPGDEKKWKWFDEAVALTGLVPDGVYSHSEGLVTPEYPDWCIPVFQHFANATPEHYRAHPPLVGGEIGYDVDGVCVNQDTGAIQERLYLFNELGVFDYLVRHPRPAIVEIGAGFGWLAYYLTSWFPEATYVIVDLPASLIYSICYLSLAMPQRRLFVCEALPAHLPPGSIVFLTTKAIHEAWATKIDLAVNLLSFGEMPEATVEGYARFLSRNLASSGFLFEQNVQFPNHDPKHYCSPQRALARVFQHHRSFQPGPPATYAAHCFPYYGHRLTTCGEPSLWRDTPFES